jgi:hypothetical protein
VRLRTFSFALAVLVGCGTKAAAPATEVDGGSGNGLFGGNAGTPIDPYDPDAALPARIEALFSSCAGGPEQVCHGSGAGNLTLRLGPGGDVVGVPSFERPDLLRVEPFAPESSYLYLKVQGDGGIDGGQMPLGGTFDPRRLDLVASWIEAGAPSP